MTEERKKYLAGITVEERAVRLAIKEYNCKIRNLKSNLTEWGDTLREDFVLLHCNHIALYKKSVKALKKQLPAPVKVLGYETDFSVICYACGKETAGRYKYCNNCGQKLK